jgi:hemerythrin
VATNLWKPDYALDIESIDEQHKRFFELCSELAQLSEACKEGCASRKELIRNVFELRLYAFKHFHTEEALMVKYNYPRCLEHFREHDSYLERLRGVVGEMEKLPAEDAEGGSPGLTAISAHLSEWAVSWWSEHIMTYDQQYARFIKQSKGRTG